MSRSGTKFELTKDHLKLLAELRWEDAEWGSGAPTADAKRPFGNSSYHGDVCRILDWEEPEDGWTEEQTDEADRIFNGLRTALEIVLQLQTFKPGTYRLAGDRYDPKWKKA